LMIRKALNVHIKKGWRRTTKREHK
jgi:hypothetical protein